MKRTTLGGLGDELIEYRTHFKWALIIIIIAFLVLEARFFYLQVVASENLSALARVSHVVRERVRAQRGAIKDRDGNIVAIDIPVHSLWLVPKKASDLDSELGKLVELGVLTEEEKSVVQARVIEATRTKKENNEVLVKRNLVSEFCPEDIERMIFSKEKKSLICPRCGHAFQDERAIVEANLMDLPGFFIRTTMTRHYPTRNLLAHVVGTVGEASKAEIERSQGRLYLGGIVGRSGVEKSLDSVLRGIDGENVYVLSAGGGRLDPSTLPPPFNEIKPSAPVAGKDVVLTIELDLQKAVMEAMANQKAGAVVVMDVETGEILAMFSHPSFDPEPAPIKSRRDDADTNPVFSPMLNKATSAYPPGSVFKMVTAIAGLMEGVITKDYELTCYGYLEYKGRKFFDYLKGGHGKTDILKALAASCDVYFYTVGDMLGIDNLAHYARDYFGFGEVTGVEIGEVRGIVPTKRFYGKMGRPTFQPGFTLNMAVGQGDLKVTPLQVARAYAALVNGGKVLKPTLVLAVGGEKKALPEVLRQVDLDDAAVAIVKEGLFRAVNSKEGTAFQARIEELPFAGKTGTAQAPETRSDVPKDVEYWLRQDHAWFVAYAPAKRPKIVVVVMVEHGGFGGQVAAPIASKIIRAYYALHAPDFADLWESFHEEEEVEPFPEVEP
jgi:penicillin-binding protein 2